MHLHHWESVSCFSASQIPLRVHWLGWLQWLMAWWWTIFFVYWGDRWLFFFFAHRYHLFLSGWVVCKISWPLSQVIHLTQMAPECSAPWVLEEDVTMLPLSNPVDRWCALLIKMESPLWGPEACWETDLVVFHMAEWSAAQECEDKYSTSLCIY